MKVTIVSVTSTPWTYESRTGVSIKAECVLEVDGKPRVGRLKLPVEQSGIQPGVYEIEPVAYIDRNGLIGFRVGNLRPAIRKEST